MTGLQRATRSRRRPRSGGKSPTVADVARLAGVSPMTVSRVVNKEDNVIAPTREKVERAIAQLGYVPNLAARALAAGQQCRLAIVYNNPSATWLSEVLVACLERASSSDAQLLVERSDDHMEPEAFAKHLVSHRVDGVVLPPPLGEDLQLLEALNRAAVRAVQIALGKPHAGVDAVGIDDRFAAEEMTRHLLQRGHRRIGFIVGNPRQSASGLRRAGFEAALAEAGVAQDPALIVQGDFSYRSGLEGADALLGLDERPTAIFASNDDMAAATIAAAHRRGLDVPADLSVCGFDDTAIATMVWPQLTTVRQPIAEMSRRATALLIDAVKAKDGSKTRADVHECLGFEIVERESVGAPP